MEDLNWADLQLALFGLSFGGLQVWWILSLLKRRERSRPMSAAAFRRSLERIWTQER